jgi:hypothetical protein
MIIKKEKMRKKTVVMSFTYACKRVAIFNFSRRHCNEIVSKLSLGVAEIEVEKISLNR